MGLPLGGEDQPVMFVLEIHYTNYEYLEGTSPFPRDSTSEKNLASWLGQHTILNVENRSEIDNKCIAFWHIILDIMIVNMY